MTISHICLPCLPSARPLDRAAAWGIFHLITGLFLIIYASHIPCYFYCVSHSTPTSVLFDFLFHFHHLLCSSTLQQPQPAQLYKNSSNFEDVTGRWHSGLDLELQPRKPRFDSSQEPTHNPNFHSFTTLLASIFGSALSTQAPVSPCWAF